MAERGSRKVRIGTVVSNKMDKTVVMKLERKTQHPVYGKIIMKTSRLHVHDENNECGVGDRIKVMETRRLSKLKHWRLVEILERAK
jgi:small subunit ribosomal protein S17